MKLATNPRDALVAMRKRLSHKRYWFKGSYAPEWTTDVTAADRRRLAQAPMCVIGTARYVTTGSPHGYSTVVADVERVLETAARQFDPMRRTGDATRTVVRFNDAPETTHDELLAVLDLAIASTQ